MSRPRAVRWGWYHSWSLHCDIEILWLKRGTQPDDWHGPFPVYSEAKRDAREKAQWERMTANHQLRQIRSLRRVA